MPRQLDMEVRTGEKKVWAYYGQYRNDQWCCHGTVQILEDGETPTDLEGKEFSDYGRDRHTCPLLGHWDYPPTEEEVKGLIP